MEAPSLTGAQRTALRGHGQTLKPALHLGKAGLTPEFRAELERQLDALELVKLRLHGSDRTERAALLEEVAAAGRCAIAGTVGQTALLYRQQPDPARRVITFS
jgi:RNA-binding protein